MTNKEKWIEKCKYWKNKWPIYEESYKDDTNGINLYTFIETLNDVMSVSDTIVSDAGSAIYVPSQNLKMIDNQIFVLSGAQADMGFALPASIGVNLADPTKNVIVITGDGSFNTNIQELATIRYLNLPIKIFVWNNSGYLSIKNTQKKFYEGRVYGTDSDHGLWFPELKNVAETYEMEYIKITSNQELKEHLKNILNKKTAIICEVICKEEQEIVPTLMLKKDKNTGKSIQCGLDDMYPFLSDEELKNEKYL